MAAEPEHLSFRCRIYRANYPTHTPCSGGCDKSHDLPEDQFCEEPCGCECHAG